MKLYRLVCNITDYGISTMLACVVRAADEQAARLLASKYASSEGVETWLDNKISLCTQITEDGEPGLILRHYVHR